MTAIKSQNRLFSIVIPTWNNLAFLKLCIQSIQRNSYYNHQIIVHVNDGSDGTLEWIKKAGIDYTHSEQNIGVCFAMNMMRTKVKTDYILFLNDDMYVLPFWDKVLYDEIEKLSDNYFFLSATSIQPHTQSASTILANYGDSIETFQEDKLLKEYMNYKINDFKNKKYGCNSHAGHCTGTETAGTQPGSHQQGTLQVKWEVWENL